MSSTKIIKPHNQGMRIFGYMPYQAIYPTSNSKRNIGRALRYNVPVVTEDADVFAQVVPSILERGNCIIVVDEAHDVYRFGSKIDQRVLDVLRKGRNKDVAMVFATTRPTSCHTDMLGVSQVYIMGMFLGLADMNYAKNYGISQPKPPYEFEMILPNGKKPRTIKSKKY